MDTKSATKIMWLILKPISLAPQPFYIKRKVSQTHIDGFYAYFQLDPVAYNRFYDLVRSAYQ